MSVSKSGQRVPIERFPVTVIVERKRRNDKPWSIDHWSVIGLLPAQVSKGFEISPNNRWLLNPNGLVYDLVAKKVYKLGLNLLDPNEYGWVRGAHFSSSGSKVSFFGYGANVGVVSLADLLQEPAPQFTNAVSVTSNHAGIVKFDAESFSYYRIHYVPTSDPERVFKYRWQQTAEINISTAGNFDVYIAPCTRTLVCGNAQKINLNVDLGLAVPELLHVIAFDNPDNSRQYRLKFPDLPTGFEYQVKTGLSIESGREHTFIVGSLYGEEQNVINTIYYKHRGCNSNSGLCSEYPEQWSEVTPKKGASNFSFSVNEAIDNVTIEWVANDADYFKVYYNRQLLGTVTEPVFIHTDFVNSSSGEYIVESYDSAHNVLAKNTFPSNKPWKIDAFSLVDVKLPKISSQCSGDSELAIQWFSPLETVSVFRSESPLVDGAELIYNSSVGTYGGNYCDDIRDVTADDLYYFVKGCINNQCKTVGASIKNLHTTLAQSSNLQVTFNPHSSGIVELTVNDTTLFDYLTFPALKGIYSNQPTISAEDFDANNKAYLSVFPGQLFVPNVQAFKNGYQVTASSFGELKSVMASNEVIEQVPQFSIDDFNSSLGSSFLKLSGEIPSKHYFLKTFVTSPYGDVFVRTFEFPEKYYEL